ncbi:MAG: AMP-binding protein, partial [Chloroflexi bacterium]|nr:AMP-binding protein [Chloroflexota bacterium]
SILNLAQPGAVVATSPLPSAFLAELRHHRIPVIVLDPLAADLMPVPGHCPVTVDYAPEAPAYILFTSGTTGVPKGVAIPYRALWHFTRWLLALRPLWPDHEVFLNQAPFNFDLSHMDLYGALLTGSTLFCITRDEIASPRVLFARLQGAPLTVWVSTPSFARFCLAERSFAQELLPNLRSFLFCGETLSSVVARALLERFPEAEVWNTYGPTETTVAVTAVRVTEEMAGGEEPLPVGWPAHGMELRICQPGGPLCSLPAGAIGEIVISGPQVALGYLGMDPGGEASGFVRLSENRLAYRTGDLGRIDPPSGLLYWHGRIDRQLKLHGYRLELEEIEAHLRHLPGVSDAAVIPVLREGQPDYLAAFLLIDPPASSELAAAEGIALTAWVRQRLSTVLPSYALPRIVQRIDTPPLTPNGKLDRRALVGTLRT